MNNTVTLTAKPRPGYQFVYWLGDVSDPTSNHTTVYLNAPKIIVAVFERTEYELKIEVTHGIPGSTRGGIRPSTADYSRRGGGDGGGGGNDQPKPPPPPPPEPPKHDPDIPVPVPEPATVLLLAVGSFFAFAGRRPRK